MPMVVFENVNLSLRKCMDMSCLPSVTDKILGIGNINKVISEFKT